MCWGGAGIGNDQAVAVRVQKLQESGIIGKFTITQPKRQLHFIPVFLVNPNFAEFETAVTAHPLTESLYKISGKWCYHLQITSENNTEFDKFLTFLLQYGYGGTLADGVWVYSNISKSHFFTLKKSKNNTF